MPTDAKVLLVIRVSLHGGRVLARDLYLGFFFFLKNFYVGQDGVEWCVMCRTAQYVEGVRGLPMPQVGVRGPAPGIFFVKIGSEKGILGQFKRPLEKRLKKAFYRNWGKKVFA